MTQKTYQYVNNFWDDAESGKQSGVDRLIYRSNKLGADRRITNTSGGNTSSKLTDKDPLTGQTVEVLWVKGSGGDLRTIQESLLAANASVAAKLRQLQPRLEECLRQRGWGVSSIRIKVPYA